MNRGQLKLAKLYRQKLQKPLFFPHPDVFQMLPEEFWCNAPDVFVVQFVTREETISAYLLVIDNRPPFRFSLRGRMRDTQSVTRTPAHRLLLCLWLLQLINHLPARLPATTPLARSFSSPPLALKASAI